MVNFVLQFKLLSFVCLFILLAIQFKELQFEEIQPMSFCYNSSLEGFRLNATILEVRDVSSRINCIIDCLAEPCCRSINYKYSTLQNKPSKCEFLHDIVKNTTSILVANTSFDHVYFIEPYKVYNSSCAFGKFECENPNHNFALGKSTAQSSTYVGYGLYYSAHLAVDGNTGTHHYNQQTNKAQCAHTRFDDKAWWRVDFGEQVPVALVVIINRGDCCWNRLRNIEIKVGDSMVNNGLENPKCGDRHSAGKGTTKITCTPIMFGRYLVIQSQLLGEAINVCEVEVYCQ